MKTLVGLTKTSIWAGSIATRPGTICATWCGRRARRRRGRAHARPRRARPTSCSSKAGALSGGQQQRASVARALYNDRPIIIGDEPVSALDRVQAAEILGACARRYETSILAMHDIPLALAHADRVIVLEEGRIVLDAPSREGGRRPTSSPITAGDADMPSRVLACPSSVTRR